MCLNGYVLVCEKLAGVGLNVCEHAGKVESHPRRQVLSHSSLEKVRTIER